MILYKSILKTLNENQLSILPISTFVKIDEMEFYRMNYQGTGYNVLLVNHFDIQYYLNYNIKEFCMHWCTIKGKSIKELPVQSFIEHRNRLPLIFKACKILHRNQII